MNAINGADPALVASQSSQQVVSTKGFDPGEGPVPLGLYRVLWKAGGELLASVFMDSLGGRWIAPTNWMSAAPLRTEGWGAVERLIPLGEAADLQRGLEYACAALRTVGDDYPGSSCQQWCHAEAEQAEEIAAGGGQ